MRYAASAFSAAMDLAEPSTYLHKLSELPLLVLIYMPILKHGHCALWPGEDGFSSLVSYTMPNKLFPS